MTSATDALRTLRTRVRNGATRLGPKALSLYHGTFSRGFLRERRAVSAGQVKYLGLRDSGLQPYLVRRNVHMLEKGLSMQPLRATFALGYIRETVDALAGIVHGDADLLSTDETRWAFDVLRTYFDHTRASTSPTVVEARDSFKILAIDAPAASSYIPDAPASKTDAVTIEAFEELANRRSSVRWYLPEPVPREIVDRAVSIALESPTACNRQPYTFYIVDQPGMVRRVAEVPMGTAGYAQGLTGIAVVVGDLAAFAEERDRHLIYIDGSLASMSFIYALESQGVSTLCINWPDIRSREREMSNLLGLSSHQRVVMLIAFGYADKSGKVPYSQKKSVSVGRRYVDAVDSDVSD